MFKTNGKHPAIIPGRGSRRAPAAGEPGPGGTPSRGCTLLSPAAKESTGPVRTRQAPERHGIARAKINPECRRKRTRAVLWVRDRSLSFTGGPDLPRVASSTRIRRVSDPDKADLPVRVRVPAAGPCRAPLRGGAADGEAESVGTPVSQKDLQVEIMKHVLWLTFFALVAGCKKEESVQQNAPPPSGEPVLDLGLRSGYSARLVIRNLNNPSCVAFRQDGALTICDSGNGRVLIREGDHSPDTFLKGFETEYWKVDSETGEKRFKLGPLSAVWIDLKTLAVTDGGRKDGEETVLFFTGPGTADTAVARTNPIPPTTDDPKDKGEGNLTGMCLSRDGKTLYVCGQGTDLKTWLLACDIETKKLEPLVSADDHGISINSPMQALAKENGNVLVLYSGAGGEEDGLIVEWDVEAKKPVARWELPGLVDPMGMDFLPDSQDTLAVVDNNWSLTKVQDGKLAIVKIPAGKDKAEVEVIGTKLKGPVSCAFGPDGRLYIAQLGEMFDQNKGNIVSVTGFVK